MTENPDDGGRFSRLAAAALASTALLAPALLSIRYSPSRSLFTVIWFALLRKPRFNPPSVVFPVAWTAIDASLAVGAYRLARFPATPERNHALALFATNVAMISGWSRLFFGNHNLGASAVGSALVVAAATTYSVTAHKVDEPAAATVVPLIAWGMFATVLSTSIWKLNRR